MNEDPPPAPPEQPAPPPLPPVPAVPPVPPGASLRDSLGTRGSPAPRPRRRGGRVLALAILAAVIAMLVVGGFVIGGWSAGGPARAATPVLIAQGSSVAGAADTLEQAGVIGSARMFRLRARLLGGSTPI